MTMDDPTPTEAGGFLPPSLPSPAPSSISSTSNLPHPRSHPLRAGSAKEDTVRRYVEGRLLLISRRYTKKFHPKDENESETTVGYESMAQVAKDLGEVIDVLWLSGTPSLQVPYLLSIAGSTNSYIASFPPSPKATFALVRKLDHAFASLLKGEDSLTGEILPGFEGGKRTGMSKTDMVRCKGLVEAARVLIVDLMGQEREIEKEDESSTETDTDLESTWDMGENFEMDVGRIYEQTIMVLGELLEGDGGFATASKSS